MSTKYASFIKSLRTQRGISQSAVADKIGLSRASYIAVEQSKRELTLGEFEKLSELLGMSFRDLEYGEIPHYEKYRQMIHAFLRLNTRIPKTKLAKLLYFADFGWYYKHLTSMSGMQYRKIQYGPVADAYFRLIDEMFDGGEISITNTENGAMLVSGTRAGAKERLSLISENEYALMRDINRKWKGKRTDEMVKFTHKQMPYLFAEDNDLVSYEVFGQEDPDDIY
ncbi:MAG: type II toxin-antitoxin system antitoxin SocA domain-containing protein [Patescibacteria group bacterium]